eukprot:3195788-Rhodomonas_salina.3
MVKLTSLSATRHRAWYPPTHICYVASCTDMAHRRTALGTDAAHGAKRMEEMDGIVRKAARSAALSA